MDYYILGMSQKDFFQHKAFEEILRERANYYVSKKEMINFWISINPKVIRQATQINSFKRTGFYKRTKETKHCVCLISSSQGFMNWIQLRLGFFENLNKKTSDKEAYSEGIFFTTQSQVGSFKSSEKEIDHNLLHLECLLTKKFINKLKKSKIRINFSKIP